jgi:HlyD family secretion protein
MTTVLAPTTTFGIGSRQPNAQITIRKHLISACSLAALLVVGFGGWATYTELAGAVVASGALVVESDVKKVQHPTGGVVGKLFVRDGDHVKAGDILISLDETQTRSNLDMIRKALDELSARRARDEAERDGETQIAFPQDLLQDKRDPDIAHLIDGETRLFAARLAARDGQRGQLSERVAQLREEISGLGEQIKGKAREIELITEELKGVRELFSKNLVPINRVTSLERDTARLQGERGQLIASTASARGKIAETQLQILQVDSDMRSEVGKDLSDIRGKWSELFEKRVAAEDQLKRVEMRAPQNGIVHQMTVHTVGGLVVPSEPAMLIVPEADQLVVEVKIQPQDIDSVQLGQNANLRFSAFNSRTTPEIDGSVSRLSADVSQDQKSGTTYYTARIAIDPEQLSRLDGRHLLPGMPVEAHLQTEPRTVLSYLTKPLMDQVAKAWKER